MTVVLERFDTSGSTGAAVTWLRTEDQVRAEAELIGDRLVGPIDEVVCYAPPQHLFGRLFGEVLPRLRDVPVQQLAGDPLTAPRLTPGARVLVVCLPSTWVSLRRLRSGLARLGSLMLLHGAGPTTPITDEVLRDLPVDHRAIELFGSTETGAVAYRDIGPAWSVRPWHLLPDVTLRTAGPGPDVQRLRISSPRLARRAGATATPGELCTDDAVRVTGPRQFEHLGRMSRLLKVNGRRCNLDHLEQLTQVLLGRPVACVPVRDDIRGEHYELFYEDTAPRPEDVWRRLTPLADSLPVPRDVHPVGHIPRTATGKIKIDQLYAEAGARKAGPT